jgi:DNA-binding NtrC family response regulator
MNLQDCKIMSSAYSTLAEPIAAPLRVSSPEEEWPLTRMAREHGGWALLGRSSAIRQLRSQIQRIAPYLRTALIRGETGCGKQAVARAIHAHSPGAARPFLVHDACALADAAARAASPVKFASEIAASAQGGTLHLTHLGELNFSRQAALQQFLEAFDERRSIHPSQRRSIARTAAPGILLLAECDRDLRTLAAIGQFRQDLYARLSAVEIPVAPLRQRTQDIAALAACLLEGLALVSGQSPKRISEATRMQLEARLWPNNLRELEQVIAQAAALAEGGLIEPRHLLASTPNHAIKDQPRLDRLEDVIERHVFDILARCGGNKVRAAETLGISRSTLYRMIGTPRTEAIETPRRTPNCSGDRPGT